MRENAIKILLTFDYELPLGGIAQSYSHSLFEPTEKLLEKANELKVPLVFFADILSYIKFREWEEHNYTEPFEKQLEKVLQSGHDVQLHLHPHWLDSNYAEGKLIPSGKFSLSDFADNNPPDNIEGMISTGIQELKAICEKAQSNYQCIAFRAGGYNLWPETSTILNSLFKHGIRFDSSICRGYYYKSDTSLVDYRNIPDKANWYLPLNGDLSKEGKEEKGILEIPIAGKPKGIFEMPTALKLGKYSYRAVENRGKIVHTASNINRKDKLKQLFSSRMLTVDNHTYSPGYMMKILDYNINKYGKEKEVLFSLIGHPKSMGEYHLYLLASFVQNAREKYGNRLEFVTFRDIFERKKL